MMVQVFRKRKEFTFERAFGAPVDVVWKAWTQPELLRQWWGPEKSTIAECEVDLRVGGRLYIVTEAGAGMGKYQGTRWPLEGTFTHIEAPRRLVYDARSWTEGEEAAFIEHVNELVLSDDGGTTVLSLHVAISAIGSGAKMAAFGMKFGYKAQLDKLQAVLAR